MVCYLLFFVLQSADGVENRDNHDTDIRKDGCPHVRKTERGERETAELDDEREHDVLLDDADALDAYQKDEYHCSVVKKHMHAVAESSVAIDYEI